ncbi:hypothetical protein JCM31598_17190 [Desulfonatronum parangueonense]
MTEGEQQGWHLYFPFLLFIRLGSQTTRLVWEEVDGSICLFKHQYGGKKRLDMMFPPTPYQENAMRHALERVNDFNNSHSCWIHFIDDKDMSQVQALKTFQLTKRNPQYLFSPQELSDLSGSRFSNLRRYINNAKRYSDIQIQPFGPEHAAQCRQLLASWETIKENKRRFLEHQRRYALNTFHFAPQMNDQDLHGHVFIINDTVRAFTFGGEIRPGIGCLLLSIADPEAAHLSYLSRRHFFAGMQGCQVVNDGTDGGTPGQKVMKQRFRPCGFHTVFMAQQVSRLPGFTSSHRQKSNSTPVPGSMEMQHDKTLPSPETETANADPTQAPLKAGNYPSRTSAKPYPPARYELRPSTFVSGQVGLFTLRPFTTDEIVVPHTYFDESRLITWEEMENLDEATRFKIFQYCYKTKKGFYAPKDINAIGISYFVNHSCDPNLDFDAKGNYISLRNIPVGEELTADLEKCMKKKNMKTFSLEFLCSCNTAQCRKVIRI